MSAGMGQWAGRDGVEGVGRFGCTVHSVQLYLWDICAHFGHIARAFIE